MKILLINPNTTPQLTDRLMASARQVLAAGTELDAVTAERGVPYISTRSEAVVGGASVLEILAERHQDYDGAIIAAFGDPGLGAARELFDLPVVGMAEAGMHSACMLGGRFSIVTFAQALEPWYAECVRWNHMESRCAAIRTLDACISVNQRRARRKSRLACRIGYEIHKRRRCRRYRACRGPAGRICKHRARPSARSCCRLPASCS